MLFICDFKWNVNSLFTNDNCSDPWGKMKKLKCDALTREGWKTFWILFDILSLRTHFVKWNHMNSTHKPPKPFFIHIARLPKKGFFIPNMFCFDRIPPEATTHMYGRENHLHKSRQTHRPQIQRIFISRKCLKICLIFPSKTLNEIKLVHISFAKVSSPSKAAKTAKHKNRFDICTGEFIAGFSWTKMVLVQDGNGVFENFGLWETGKNRKIKPTRLNIFWFPGNEK